MADMARKYRAGDYQIGIYSVMRGQDRQWHAYATGPGTIGDGYAGKFKTLEDAHKQLTGEGRKD